MEGSKNAKKALVARRTLTPMLLDHAAADTLVSLGGLRGIVEDLPDWCKRPDFETCVWLNGALEQLWPHLSAALSDKIGTVVGNILAKITPLGISLSFSEFTLGTEPLYIRSVKKTGTLASSSEEIILDLDVRWCGNPTVVLNVEIMGLPLKIRLNELQIVGPMRICLARFDDRLPCFHLMKVAFVEQPSVKFQLKLIGGDIDMLPGVKETVTEIIGKSLAKALVWPKYVKVPIAVNKEDPNAERPGVTKSDPFAILELTLVRGKKLKNASAFGTSDPFVTMRLSGTQKEFKSSVVVDDLSPTWDETFKIIVDDPSQSVQVVVGDYHALADDAGVKRFGRALKKMDAMCFAWGRRVRKKIYDKLFRRRRTKPPKTRDGVSDDALDVESRSMFQTVMGTGRLQLKDLKPFVETVRTVELSKDAMGVLAMFGSGVSGSRARKRLAAGSVEFRCRLVPLSASEGRTRKNLAKAGRVAQEIAVQRRAAMGVKDPRGFLDKYLKKEENEKEEGKKGGGGRRGKKAEPSSPRDAAKREEKLEAASIEYLVHSVLSGEKADDGSATRGNLLRLKPMLNGLLHVTLVRGEGLVEKDSYPGSRGSSDPFFKVKLKSQRWRSPVKHQTVNPVYDCEFDFVVNSSDLLNPDVAIEIECWDKDMVGKDFMGNARVFLRDVVRGSLVAGGGSTYTRVKLEGVESGAVHLKFRYQPVDTSMKTTDTTTFLASYSRVRRRDADRNRRANAKRGCCGLAVGAKGQKYKLRDSGAYVSDGEDEDDAGRFSDADTEEDFDFGDEDEDELARIDADMTSGTSFRSNSSGRSRESSIDRAPDSPNVERKSSGKYVRV